MPTDLMPLEFLNNGDWADIADVTGEAGWVTRLAEMGVRIGSRLRVVQAGSQFEQSTVKLLDGEVVKQPSDDATDTPS